MGIFNYSKINDEGVRRNRNVAVGLGILWFGLATWRMIAGGTEVWFMAANFLLAAAFALQFIFSQAELNRRKAAFDERNAQMRREAGYSVAEVRP